MSSLIIKFYCNDDVRRATILVPEGTAWSFDGLKQKLQIMAPEISLDSYKLIWKDAENDDVALASTEDLSEALQHLCPSPNGPILRVFAVRGNEVTKPMALRSPLLGVGAKPALPFAVGSVKVDVDQDHLLTPEQLKHRREKLATLEKLRKALIDPPTNRPAVCFKLDLQQQSEVGKTAAISNQPVAVEETQTVLPAAPKQAEHRGVTCDGCGNGVTGNRYKCLICDDFDLCCVCEVEKHLHDKHPMIRIVDPQDVSWRQQHLQARTLVNNGVQSPTSNAPTAQLLSRMTPEQRMRKCGIFFQTLISLAKAKEASKTPGFPPNATSALIRLIQDLIDNVITAERFVKQLETIVKSAPQPSLAGFLKEALPNLRAALLSGAQRIEGIRPPMSFSFAPTNHLGQNAQIRSPLRGSNQFVVLNPQQRQTVPVISKRSPQPVVDLTHDNGALDVVVKGPEHSSTLRESVETVSHASGHNPNSTSETIEDGFQLRIRQLETQVVNLMERNEKLETQLASERLNAVRELEHKDDALEGLQPVTANNPNTVGIFAAETTMSKKLASVDRELASIRSLLSTHTELAKRNDDLVRRSRLSESERILSLQSKLEQLEQALQDGAKPVQSSVNSSVLAKLQNELTQAEQMIESLQADKLLLTNELEKEKFKNAHRTNDEIEHKDKRQKVADWQLFAAKETQMFLTPSDFALEERAVDEIRQLTLATPEPFMFTAPQAVIPVAENATVKADDVNGIRNFESELNEFTEGILSDSDDEQVDSTQRVFVNYNAQPTAEQPKKVYSRQDMLAIKDDVGPLFYSGSQQIVAENRFNPPAWHRNPAYADSLRRLLAMGFSNDDGRVSALLEAKHGDLNAVLDELNSIPPY